jgi:hypothetical protein
MAACRASCLPRRAPLYSALRSAPWPLSLARRWQRWNRSPAGSALRSGRSSIRSEPLLAAMCPSTEWRPPQAGGQVQNQGQLVRTKILRRLKTGRTRSMPCTTSASRTARAWLRRSAEADRPPRADAVPDPTLRAADHCPPLRDWPFIAAGLRVPIAGHFIPAHHRPRPSEGSQQSAMAGLRTGGL